MREGTAQVRFNGEVRDWAAELNRRADEVLATLRDEGVVVESVFLEQTASGDFLIYYMKAQSIERASELPAARRAGSTPTRSIRRTRGSRRHHWNC